MLLKKINNTLEKSCVVMTKIRNGSIINAALAKKSHLWCHFIFLILTRTGLHTKNYLCQVVDLQCLIIVGARIRGVTVGLVSSSPVTALKKNNVKIFVPVCQEKQVNWMSLSLCDCWQWNGRLRMYFEARRWIRSTLQTSSIDWGAHTCVAYPRSDLNSVK